MIYFWQEVYNFCRQITHRIGEKLLADFAQLEPTHKADGSLVTEADKWADFELRKAIKQCFPTHGVLTEETEHILPPTDWCWVIDPIDGTTNFTRGIPIWGISIGLLYQGIPVFGFIHFPQINQTYHGYFSENNSLTSPKGAYLNNNPIYTSFDRPSFNHVVMFCNRSLDILKNPFPCKIRITGVTSYDLMSVAFGATLGAIEASPKIWDIAGGYPILRAAGGNLVHLGEANFPLTKGVNYGDVGFPCLAVAQENLIATFKPLVEVGMTSLKPKIYS
jgi:myo-inositol-1(or 4)-monophosphatase